MGTDTLSNTVKRQRRDAQKEQIQTTLSGGVRTVSQDRVSHTQRATTHTERSYTHTELDRVTHREKLHTYRATQEPTTHTA